MEKGHPIEHSMEERHPMEDTKLGAVESRFADIIWRQEPLTSGELVKFCREELEWKKSTTYTVLKKLCDRGIFQNQDGCVTSLISRQAFHAAQSRKFVEETFEGSLPAFIAAFASQKRLSQGEIQEIRRMIDAYEAHRSETHSAGSGRAESNGSETAERMAQLADWQPQGPMCSEDKEGR